ncbi:lipopolysaccharide biosynthesis protein [Proteus columbae]|uniref:lipopolysaccharide biosynthesis protein n=1 Tax=Proteus columbae TaxID=1987580 RepID=UPI0034D3DDAA
MNIRSNIIYMYIAYLFNMLFPLIIVPLLTNNLSLENYGKYSLVYTCFSFAIILSDFSFNITGIRNYLREDSNYNRNIIYQKIQSSKKFISYITTFLLTLYIHYLYHNTYISIIFFLSTILGLHGYINFSSWYFQAIGRLKNNTIYLIMMKILSLLLILIVTKIDKDNWINIYACSTVLYYPFGLIIVKKINIEKIKIKTKSILVLIKENFGLFLADFLPNLYNLIPIIVLGMYISASDYAIFSLSNRIALIICGFIYVFLKAVYPYFCTKDKIKTDNFILLLVAITSLGYLINYNFGEYIIAFIFGSDYQYAQVYLNYIFIGIISISISETILYSYLLPKNKDRFIVRISLIIVFLSVILLLLTFNSYKQWAVIYTVIFARVLYSLIYISYYYFLKNEES